MRIDTIEAPASSRIPRLQYLLCALLALPLMAAAPDPATFDAGSENRLGLTFTPDGKTIVFANSRENNYEIYSMSADGSKERRLTENTIMDIRPRVSPDGNRIAFVSTRDGNYEVYVMNLDGSRVQRVTHSEERDDYPAWHPNGKQLVIASERDGEFDLYLFDVESTQFALGN